LDVIRLKNMQFFAYHGNQPAEAEQGQRFEVDLEVQGDWSTPGISDNLDDAINYETLFAIVSETVTSKRYNLIEALAEEICRQVITHIDMAKRVKVCIRKPKAPLRGILDYVEVEIERE